MTAQAKCPKCRRKAIPIVYGHPTAEMEDARARGEVDFGGCMVGLGTEPDFRCTSCGHRWRIPRPPRDRFTEGRRALAEALESIEAGDLDHVRTLARTMTDAGRDEGRDEGHAQGRAEGKRAGVDRLNAPKTNAAQERIDKVVALVKEGWKSEAIAKELGVSRETVKRDRRAARRDRKL